MRRLLALLFAMVFLAACASNDLADQGNRSRAGNSKADADGKKKNGKEVGGGNGNAPSVPDEIEDEAEQPGAGNVAGEDAPEGFGGENAPSSKIDPSLARASIAVDDATNDAKKQGITPNYTETTRASIQGLGETVRFTMRFGGNPPQQVQKDQYMVIAFGITGRKADQGIAIGATCDEKGWHPYAGAKGERTDYPGTFEIQGTEIVMEIPWSFVKGPRAFEWYSSAGWYGKIANQTHWAFDSVPNEKAAKFPG